MGSLAADTADKRRASAKAFVFVLSAHFHGVILTGTSRLDHLLENIAAFQEAKAAVETKAGPADV